MNTVRANSQVIGAFVAGGGFLLIAALVLFSSSDLFTPKRKFVAYFEQSVNGLNVGAPVKFRGIPLGSVLEIDGDYDAETGDVIPRLIIEISPQALRNAWVEDGEYTLFPGLVKNGMRASLKSQSLLTGQLYVSLDFHPDSPVRTFGKDDEYPEMPTLDSGFDEALAKLSELPIEELIARASSTLEAAEAVLSDPDLEATLAALPSLVSGLDQAIVDLRAFVNGDLGGLADEASQALSTTTGAMEQVTSVVTGETLVQLDSTLAEVDKTLQLLRQRLGEDDRVTIELLATLREASSALRSVRELADQLEENPESLLRGKSNR